MASLPTTLALVLGWSVFEPTYAIVMVAVQTRIFCWSTPTDTVLKIQRTASIFRITSSIRIGNWRRIRTRITCHGAMFLQLLALPCFLATHLRILCYPIAIALWVFSELEVLVILATGRFLLWTSIAHLGAVCTEFNSLPCF